MVRAVELRGPGSDVARPVRRWRRFVLAAVGMVVLLAGSGAIAYQVFAPHELLVSPSVPYPEVEVITDERPFSELRAAPLVVEGRLRVYAEKWRVWSDAPVGERYETSPYWSFRRWPAQVVGVTLAPTAGGGTVVVSQWSDGEIVAIDARRGVIAWRDSGPIAGSRSYDGRRTGATVVYTPRSLLTAQAADGTVLIVTAPNKVIGFDAMTGRRLWEHDFGQPGPAPGSSWCRPAPGPISGSMTPRRARAGVAGPRPTRRSPPRRDSASTAARSAAS
jgi:hypothetical protein